MFLLTKNNLYSEIVVVSFCRSVPACSLSRSDDHHRPSYHRKQHIYLCYIIHVTSIYTRYISPGDRIVSVFVFWCLKSPKRGFRVKSRRERREGNNRNNDAKPAERDVLLFDVYISLVHGHIIILVGMYDSIPLYTHYTGGTLMCTSDIIKCIYIYMHFSPHYIYTCI